jgi:RsiW-degrading membrane proteinase PrsW (M82 family)
MGGHPLCAGIARAVRDRAAFEAGECFVNSRRTMQMSGGGLPFTSDPALDRLLMGSPLRRREVCARICAALFGLLIFAFLVHLGVVAGMRPEATRVFFWALMLSTLLSTAPVALLWFLDRREREKRFLLVAAFLWGGLIATAISLPFNTAFFRLADAWVMDNPIVSETLGPDATAMLAAPVSAPIVEEIAKALGVLVIFWLLRAEFDNMRDGIVYGALVGIGFNWYEAALYVVQSYDEHGTASYGWQLGARYALFGLGGHALFTGIFGAFLGFAIQTRYVLLRVAAPLAGLLIAIMAHMLNNALPLLATLAHAASGEQPEDLESRVPSGFFEFFAEATRLQFTIYWPIILLMALAVWRSGVWERRVIREELADEVGRAVTADEYRDVLRDHIFRTRRIDSDRPHLSAALIEAQHELAFRKRRVRDEGSDPETDLLARGWREDIRRLREAL